MPLFPPDRLAAWTNGRWTTLPAELVRGFNPDSRTVQPGQVFVALRTEKRDGHDFLPAAAASGESKLACHVPSALERSSPVSGATKRVSSIAKR